MRYTLSLCAVLALAACSSEAEHPPGEARHEGDLRIGGRDAVVEVLPTGERVLLIYGRGVDGSDSLTCCLLPPLPPQEKK